MAMVPEVCGPCDWAEVDSPAEGTVYVPSDVFSSAEWDAVEDWATRASEKYSPEADRAEALATVPPCLSGYFGERRVYSVTVRRNVYGVRLTLPGCLDSTDWELFDTKAEADARAAELEPCDACGMAHEDCECEGEARDCATCQGRGAVGMSACAACQGTGTVRT